MDQLIEGGHHLLAGETHREPGDGDDGEQAQSLRQGQHAHLELHVILHLVDEVIDGGDELLRVVGVAAGGGVLDVFAHHLPLQQHLAIGAAQGGGVIQRWVSCNSDACSVCSNWSSRPRTA